MTSDGPPRLGRYDDLLVLGGCPRSGTTLAQLLLHATGRVDTSNETHLLAQIVGPSIRRYRTFALQRMDGHRDVGPHVILDTDSYNGFFRMLVDEAMARMRARGRAAPLVCEKTPENILFWPELAELLPGVRFVEIVRDPRAVYASTKAAADKWAGSWATVGPGSFARRWIHFIRAGSALEASALPSIRLSYERLVGKGSTYLREMFGRIGIELGAEEADAIRAATRIQVIKHDENRGAPWSLSAEPVGFFRRGEVASWRGELSADEIAEIEAVAGEEMRRLGYRI